MYIQIRGHVHTQNVCQQGTQRAGSKTLLAGADGEECPEGGQTGPPTRPDRRCAMKSSQTGSAATWMEQNAAQGGEAAVRILRGGGFLKQSACRTQLRYDFRPLTGQTELCFVSQGGHRVRDGARRQPARERTGGPSRTRAGPQEERQGRPAATRADKEAETGPTREHRGRNGT